MLDGRTGKPITSYKTSAPVHSSPLSVSMEGSGNDLFLFWSADCMGHEHEGGWFEYVNGTNVHESSRADSCMARYSTKSFSKFYVTNRRVGFPGTEIYFSSKFIYNMPKSIICIKMIEQEKNSSFYFFNQNFFFRFTLSYLSIGHKKSVSGKINKIDPPN